MKALLRSRIRFLRYLLALVIFLPEVVQATHLRAGNILMTLIDCELRRYKIRVEVYTNTTNTNVLFGGEQDYLDFGDRTGRVLVPEIRPDDPRYSTLGLPTGTARAYYEVIHDFAGPGTYTVSYVEPNRNAGVVNMDQSVNTTFYLETQVVIDPFYGCSSPAILEVPPIDRACTTVAWFHNPGAKDLDGDRLSYQMVIPFRDRGTTVLNYQDPNAKKFYPDFNNGQEPRPGGNPPWGDPEFGIDAVDGTVTWNAPGTAGEYNIAFIVIDWRLINGQWRQMGYVRRDMQILVEECDNKRPELVIPEDICVTAGTTIDKIIKGTDPDGDRIRITAFSETFTFPAQQSPATIIPNDEKDAEGKDVYYPSPTQVAFHWATDCEHIRQQPYTVNFKVQDQRGLVNYKTWRITVVGPAPIWNDANLNVATRTATIKWDRYLCQNAELIEVWRKVDSTSFKPDTCQTGMPDGLGYERITTVPARIPPSQATGQYVDNNNGKGLAPGAKYCYRLVAVFPLPQGGESYVTQDICVGPLPADVPIITNVSVEKTSAQDGLIRVSWKRPFDLNPVAYPTDSLKYEVYRAPGDLRGNDSTLVATLLGDTTYLDGGLNTEASMFNYNVVAYNGHRPSAEMIGASEVASSVRLGSSSQKDQITLDWRAEVPWSNQIEAHPYHYIYRGGENDTEDQLLLVDSVQVTATAFQYVDNGLETGKTYCYRVLTNGGYGNPTKIPEPLKNFSQRICVQPGDSIPPCKLLVKLESQGCDDIKDPSSLCQLIENSLSNTISWSSSESQECQTDIVQYKVYEGGYNGEYVLRATLDATTTQFTHQNLSSFAHCYRVTAIDFSGNESEMSDAVCNDNCPAYGLPNVFTPYDSDDDNNLFSAFTLRDCEGGEAAGCPDYVIQECARFVLSVRFTVYNRWGREVYTYEAPGNDESIYIDWNGKDKNGNRLDPAVYYYTAEVTFDVLNPNDAVKRFKGWVHLLGEQQ